ncbi:hypothetical protein GCM10022393_10980 [Aquimarina addita]|uniref:DUF3298 domain-containing protein n=1 Tax=Aquimarina addita TaxID=870485 RepID=A0ABP7XDC8_9FLAO
MRTLTSLLCLVLVLSCKNPSSESNSLHHDKETSNKAQQDTILDTVAFLDEETLEFTTEKTKPLKKQILINAPDDKFQLSTLVIAKEFYKEEDMYILDYKYPFLNEKLDEGYTSFNNFLTENYLNIEATENEILEDKYVYCDSIGVGRCMDKRIIDYKIYAVNEELISMVLYKENYYSGMKHSTYMFECLNYDLTKYGFKHFQDFFIPGSEKEIFEIINATVREQINSGELYLDCWELSQGDFQAYKNNFVINDDHVEYYFDDCIICPSYTGTYSIKIPIKKVMHLIKKYNNKPLIG